MYYVGMNIPEAGNNSPYTVEQLTAVSPEEVALELAKIGICDRYISDNAFRLCDYRQLAVWWSVEGSKEKQLENIGFLFGLVIEGAIHFDRGNVLETLSSPVKPDLSQGYGAFLKSPKDNKTTIKIAKNMSKFNVLQGLYVLTHLHFSS